MITRTTIHQDLVPELLLVINNLAEGKQTCNKGKKLTHIMVLHVINKIDNISIDVLNRRALDLH